MGGKGILGIPAVKVISFIIFFAGFWFSFSAEDWGCPLFSPVPNRPGEGEGAEKVNVDLLSLISIGGCFFLCLLGFGIL